MTIMSFSKQERILKAWDTEKLVKAYNSFQIGEIIDFLKEERDISSFVVSVSGGVYNITLA